MEKAILIEDDLWDHYSGLPSPLWYQQQNEENNTDHLDCSDPLATKDQEGTKKQMGSLKDKQTKK